MSEVPEKDTQTLWSSVGSILRFKLYFLATSLPNLVQYLKSTANLSSSTRSDDCFRRAAEKVSEVKCPVSLGLE